ncbi:hypothetical protein SDC9_150623 [bioreactor metagenome]|uniref:HTH arsR-type domain-containing protein n=1 Tax=bioreactor metagenome TaxID=1076179 RepID=A0A645ES93_9ZZZZ
MENRNLPPEFLAATAEMIRILGHGQRLQILEYLDLHGESNVGDIVTALAAPQGAISQHLNKMRLAGVLECRRDRREVYYRIAEERAVTILNCLRKKFAELQNIKG